MLVSHGFSATDKSSKLFEVLLYEIDIELLGQIWIQQGHRETKSFGTTVLNDKVQQNTFHINYYL